MTTIYENLVVRFAFSMTYKRDERNSTALRKREKRNTCELNVRTKSQQVLALSCKCHPDLDDSREYVERE